eukprot:TRINITY_DN1140_c0_g1_i6.p3 TRINITY_DN1140_c0_g1~~TRINITY_DN1140_c0_g1_i6.p3  ORF type:complete len:128 (+),score=22.12 TRINITY_DN1140_c0_g1_i6:7-390(+)
MQQESNPEQQQQQSNKQKKQEVFGFYCAEELQQFLQCVIKKKEPELHCLDQLKALKTCVRKENVVDFTFFEDHLVEELSERVHLASQQWKQDQAKSKPSEQKEHHGNLDKQQQDKEQGNPISTIPSD